MRTRLAALFLAIAALTAAAPVLAGSGRGGDPSVCTKTDPSCVLRTPAPSAPIALPTLPPTDT